MRGKQENRAESLLPEVLPDLIAVLNEAPFFGVCGLDVTFHEGEITRIITRIEKCRKTSREGEK